MRKKLLTLDRTSYRRLGVILLSCALLSGCGGSHAEYDPKSPWIGTRATFGPAMAYISILPNDYGDKETLRINQDLDTLEHAEEDKRFEPMMKNVMITPVPEGTTFKVVSIYTVVHDGYSRWFAPDYEMLVLKDSHGNISTIMVDAFQVYAKEQTGGPTGGSKK